jgi:hypothetical protein
MAVVERYVSTCAGSSQRAICRVNILGGGVLPPAISLATTELSAAARWKSVDASEYRRAGSPSMHQGAPLRVLELVDEALARWSPAAAACIDVASSGELFGIVEANCINAARLYAADAEVVLSPISEHARSAVQVGP